MTELRSYVKRNGSLYLISTGSVSKDLFETVLFAVHPRYKNPVREIHREFLDTKQEAVARHKEYFESLRLQ